MWLDDDEEDDDPTPGPVPDPSERLWRHPSEIAAERAMAAANAAEPPSAEPSTAVPVRQSTSDGPSILWPIAVVGGSIAVAAFGVLGLYNMGAPGSARQQVAGAAIAPADNAINTTVAQTRELDMPSTMPLAPLASDGQDSNSWLAEGETASNATTTLLLPTAEAELEPSTTSLVENAVPAESGAEVENVEIGPPPAPPQLDSGGISSLGTSIEPPPSIGSEVLADAPQSALRLGPSSLAHFAIYDAADANREALASVLAVDGRLLSSAAALGDRESIWVRVGENFHRAIVAGRDAPSDVALIRLTDEASELELPTIDLATPTTSKLSVSVGYCGADGSKLKPLGGQHPSWCETSGVELESTPQSPSEPSSAASALHGHAYPASTPGETISNHTVYGPIKTDIRWTPEMSGAPLRDDRGHIVGMVVGGLGQYVFAVPIERVLTVAESLSERGTGSPAWIGIEAWVADDGLLVASVSEQSPLAAQIQAGDLLVTANGEQLQNWDHLIHLVREAGVGATMNISFINQGGRGEVEIEIAAAPIAD